MRAALITTMVGGYVLAAVLLIAVTSPLNHDEHQFMASAYLVATQGIQPYQDFPYFHMPNLVYLYALLLPLSAYPLLLARLFVGLCAVGIALLVYRLSSQALAGQAASTRLYGAAGLTLLLVNSPLLATATAHVWNHTPATLCALLAFFLLVRALQRGRGLLFGLSGCALGMAIGIRLSFAPLLLPFAIALLWFAGLGKVRRGLLFAAGCAVANLPALYFLATHFTQFWFGNIGYAALNTLYRQETDFGGAMSLLDKLIYLVKGVYVQPGDLLIVVVVLYLVLNGQLAQIRQAVRRDAGFGLLLLSLPFLYLGALAPTPAWYQYFFAPLPFLLLLVPYWLAQEQPGAKQHAAFRLLLVTALLSVLFGPFVQSPRALLALARPAAWFPIQFHNNAQAIAQAVTTTAPTAAPAPLLTLAPLYAVESGLPIYPALATGPFAWRIGSLLPAAERQTQGMIAVEDLTALFQQRPPAAILVTNNPEDRTSEAPLQQLARQQGYAPQPLADDSTLWLRRADR